MKKITKYLVPLLKIGCIVLVNAILYSYNLSLVLEWKYIAMAIFATSAIDILLFGALFERSKQVRMAQGAVYVLAVILKISAMVYFKQYGNYDIFERVRQAVYLVNVTDYIVEQLTWQMCLVGGLSILYGWLLIRNPKYPLFAGQAEGKAKKLRMIGVFAVLVILTWQFKELQRLEIYRASLTSLYSVVSGKDEITLPAEAANQTTASAGVGLPYAKIEEDGFRNYKHHNSYTGIGEGKNLLIIQVESLQDNFINKDYNGKEITPNLNRLIGHSFYFTDYFELLGFGNSSDAEYVSLHSTYSNLKKGAYEEYKDTETFGLPKIAAAKGYHTFSAHGNTGEFYNRKQRHPGIGFEKVYMGEDFVQDEIIGMGLSDASMFRQMMPKIKQAHRNGKFMGFLITLTCHGPFDMPERDQVFDVKEELKNSTFAKYLNAVYYTDKVIGELLEQMEEEGILKDTVVAIYGDHHAFANVNQEDNQHMAEFLGKPYDFDEMMRIPLIVYVPGYEKAIVRENIGSQIDFMPTICNIMGWNDTVTPMLGVDLLDDSLSRNNIVFPQTYLLQGSFITDERLFEKSRILDGMEGRLIDRKSRKSLPLKEASAPFRRSFEVIPAAQDIYYHNEVKDLIRNFAN